MTALEHPLVTGAGLPGSECNVRPAKSTAPDHVRATLRVDHVPILKVVENPVGLSDRRDRIGIAMQDNRRIITPGKLGRTFDRALLWPIGAGHPFDPEHIQQTWRIGRKSGRISQNARSPGGSICPRFGKIGSIDREIRRRIPTRIRDPVARFRVYSSVMIVQMQQWQIILPVGGRQSTQELRLVSTAIQGAECAVLDRTSCQIYGGNTSVRPEQINRNRRRAQFCGQRIIGRSGIALHVSRATRCHRVRRRHNSGRLCSVPSQG